MEPIQVEAIFYLCDPVGGVLPKSIVGEGARMKLYNCIKYIIPVTIVDWSELVYHTAQCRLHIIIYKKTPVQEIRHSVGFFY